MERESQWPVIVKNAQAIGNLKKFLKEDELEVEILVYWLWGTNLRCKRENIFKIYSNMIYYYDLIIYIQRYINNWPSYMMEYYAANKSHALKAI